MVVIVINCVKIDNYHYFASSALFQIDAFKEVRSPGRTLIEAKIHIGTQVSHPHPRKQRAVGCALCGVPANNVQWGALCRPFRTKRRILCHTSGLLTKRDYLTLLDSPLTNVKQI